MRGPRANASNAMSTATRTNPTASRESINRSRFGTTYPSTLFSQATTPQASPRSTAATIAGTSDTAISCGVHPVPRGPPDSSSAAPAAA